MKTGNKLIIGLIALLPLLSKAQTVDFSFSTANNLYCSPQQVTFTQLCSGTPDGFIWRFGNGASGILPTESTTYTNPGTYSVTLIAIYADVAISTIKNVVINPTPVISIAADKYKICQPGIINFTASGSPFITSYEWNFGDGSPIVTTAVNNSSHFFNTYNDFIVTVKGISAAGCSSSTFDTVSVERFGILSANINPPGGCIPINVTLVVSPAAPQGDPPVNYTWDFGDGSPTVNTSTALASHIYTTTAPITTANVIITTASGCTTQHTYVPPFAYGTPPTNPVATTTDGNTTYCGSETIEFSGTATGANYYLWDYGDGVKDSVQFPTITHRYRTLGMKRVIMTPYFNGCPGVESDTIDLNIIGVVADYTYHNLCAAKNHFVYENLSLGNVTSFRWTFSDIPNSPDFTNFNTSHTFPANGAFTTKFYLYDAITGCSDSLIYDQFTSTPIFTSTKSNVCKDSLIKYAVVNPYPAGSGYLYVFHVNGLIAHTIYPELSLKPDQHGLFNEYVVIEGPTDNTCDDTVYLPRPTSVGGPVLSASLPYNACILNNSFPITNNTHPFFANEPLITWEWNFGDNTTSNLPIPPPHTYSNTGTFWVHFKVTDVNGCAQADSQLVRVNPTPEIYVLPRADTICAGDSIQLLAFTVNNLAWTTNYNISCLTCDTVMVKPLTSTNYIAEATNIFGCANRDTSRIKVYEPIVLRVTPADTSFCSGGQVQFNANVKNGIINWSPANYLSAVNISNPVSKPDSSVTYRIIVNDSAACFADTVFAVVKVNYKPTVNAGNDQVVPYYHSFTLNPTYSADVVSWRWSPAVNGLSCTFCPVVSGIATQTATHTIEVKTVHGCTAKDEVNIIVDCSKANLNLPSAFTPDNNGKNDWFYPMARGYRSINKFVVYNRWGNKVFERYNFSPNIASLGWNGKGSDKQIVDTGVFVWLIEATCDVGQKIELKGTVTVLR